MTREFVIMPEFERQWKNMNLGDKDLRKLQEQLLLNPNIGAVVQGTGGLRKMRFAFEGKGKSGSVRVVYVDFVIHNVLFLIFAYPKSEKDNLTQAERNSIKNMINQIEKSMK